MKVVKVLLVDSNKVDIDALMSSNLFNEDDIEYFHKIKNETVKRETIVSTYLKRKYIGDYYLNEFHKPLSLDKFFNISHSHGMVALVIDECEVGIDIEMIRTVDDDLIKYISNDEEYKYIKDYTNFFEIWTNKEALVKAKGVGISNKISEIPALPLNSLKTFNDEKYFNKTIKYNQFIITVSKKSESEFNLELIEENLSY